MKLYGPVRQIGVTYYKKNQVESSVVITIDGQILQKLFLVSLHISLNKVKLSLLHQTEKCKTVIKN